MVVVYVNGKKKKSQRVCPPLLRLWGTSRSNVYGGGDGVIYQFNGRRWRKRAKGLGGKIKDMWGRSSGELFFLIWGAPAVYVFDGNSVAESLSFRPEDVSFEALSGNDQGEVYVVGTRYIGRAAAHNTAEPLLAVNRGTGWEKVTTPFDYTNRYWDGTERPERTLTTPDWLWVSHSGEIFVSEYAFGMAYYDGSEWSWHDKWVALFTESETGEVYALEQVLGDHDRVVVWRNRQWEDVGATTFGVISMAAGDSRVFLGGGTAYGGGWFGGWEETFGKLGYMESNGAVHRLD
jgi:hypothetical protein